MSVFVALLIQHAKCMRRIILSSVASPELLYITEFSGEKKVIEHKMRVLVFFCEFVWKISRFKKCSQTLS